MNFIWPFTGIAIALIAVANLATADSTLPPDASGLPGTSWKLIDLPGKTLAPHVSSTLELGADGVASGSDGCNRYGGSWAATTAALRFSILAGTRMACPEPVMEPARAVIAALGAARAYAFDGGRLVLQNIGHQAVLAGHSVCFTTASQLLLDLAAQDSARGLDRRLRHYGSRTSLLIVDSC